MVITLLETRLNDFIGLFFALDIPKTQSAYLYYSKTLGTLFTSLRNISMRPLTIFVAQFMDLAIAPLIKVVTHTSFTINPADRIALGLGRLGEF